MLLSRDRRYLSSSATSGKPANDALPEESTTTVDREPPSAVGDLRLGLVHHWKFDETRGDVARDSIGRNNISLGNWESEDPRWVAARIANGLQFSKPEQIALTAVARFKLRF